MNKRITKKLACRYLDGCGASFRYRTVDYPTGSGDIRSELMPVSDRMLRAIRNEAFRRGWNGNHWDSPFLIAHGDTAGFAATYIREA